MDWDDFEYALKVIDSSPVAAVDTEGHTENKNQWLLTSQTIGISAAVESNYWYFPFRHVMDNLPMEWLPKLGEVLSRHPRLVMHHAKHDIKAFEKDSIDIGDFYCTLLMIHWIDEELPSKALDFVSKMFGGPGKKRPASMQAIIDAPLMGWKWVPVDQMTEYSGNDSFATYDIYKKLLPEFQAQGFDGELWGVEQDFIRLVNKMEWNGIHIDTDMCEREIQHGNEVMENLKDKIGGNPNSPKDLERILLHDLELPIKKRTKTGRPSFDKFAMEQYDEILETMDNPLAKQVQEYRGWSRVVSSNYESYLRLLSPDRRLRPNYNLHRVRTPRMSCSDPNLQNIPRIGDKPWNGNLKKVFIPEPEFDLIDFDYKNLEFRLAAAYGKQADLIAYFDDREAAIFKEVSQQLGMPYNDTKTLTYAIMYGSGVNRVKNLFGFTDIGARQIVNKWWSTYPGIAKANNLAKNNSSTNGYVTVWSGRRRHGDLGHKAFNAVIQGGAAEIVKRAALRCQQFESETCRMLLHVHDSLVWEIHKSVKERMVPLIKREMEAVPEPFGVSFFVDVKTWGE